MGADVSIFGVRHHGPGSARSLRRALEELQPDALLVEGPPDAEALLPLLTHEEMRPPVALLVYARDEPRRAAYWPFAAFSPEWQALEYGLRRGIAVRFMDLPFAHRLALEPVPPDQSPTDEDDTPADPAPASSTPTPAPPDSHTPAPPDRPFHADPLAWLAEAAGYNDAERWWEQVVE